jgi:hypothetical protein
MAAAASKFLDGWMWKTLLSVALCEWSKQNISNNLKLLYS